MLSLNPSPTFKLKVGIPVPGKEPVPVEFTYKHKDRDEFNAFLRGPEAADRSDTDTVMGLICGWDGIEAAFGEDTVGNLLANYHGAASAIVDSYIHAMLGHPLKG